MQDKVEVNMTNQKEYQFDFTLREPEKILSFLRIPLGVLEQLLSQGREIALTNMIDPNRDVNHIEIQGVVNEEFKLVRYNIEYGARDGILMHRGDYTAWV